MKRNRFFKCFALALALFFAYSVLDTFVLSESYTVVETTAAETSVSEETAAESVQTSSKKSRKHGSARSASANTTTSDLGSSSNKLSGSSSQVTDSSYSDGNISISIDEYDYCGTTVYVADVEVSSADLLKTAFANNTYGKNVTAKVSDTAESVGAVLAINGDYYGVQEKGYVLRNGVLYRNTAVKGKEDLVIYEDGSFEIIVESEVTAEELLAKGAVQVLSFGPALVEDGEITVDADDEVGKAKSSNPRTAIAVAGDLHYLFIVSDGRTDESEGLSLLELAEFAKSLGAETVYNLDGGGSSTMVFNGNVINNPTSGGSIKERSVSDIVYIGY